MSLDQRIRASHLSDEDAYEVKRCVRFAAGWLRRLGPLGGEPGSFTHSALSHLDEALAIMGEPTSDDYGSDKKQTDDRSS